MQTRMLRPLALLAAGSLAVRVDDDEAAHGLDIPGAVKTAGAADDFSKAMSNFAATQKEAEHTEDSSAVAAAADPHAGAEEAKTAISSAAAIPVAPAPSTKSIDWRVGTVHIDPSASPTPYPTPGVTEYHSKWFYPTPNGDEGKDIKDINAAAQKTVFSLWDQRDKEVARHQNTIVKFGEKENQALKGASTEIQKVYADSNKAIRDSRAKTDKDIAAFKEKAKETAQKDAKAHADEKVRISKKEAVRVKAMQAKEGKDVLRVNERAKIIEKQIEEVQAREPPIKRAAEKELSEANAEHEKQIDRTKEVAEEVTKNATQSLAETKQQVHEVNEQTREQLIKLKATKDGETKKVGEANLEENRLKAAAAVQVMQARKADARQVATEREEAQKEEALAKKYVADASNVRRAEESAIKVAKDGDEADLARSKQVIGATDRKKATYEATAKGMKDAANKIIEQTTNDSRKQVEETKLQLDRAVRGTAAYEASAERLRQGAAQEISRIRQRDTSMMEKLKEGREGFQAKAQDSAQEAKEKVDSARATALREVREAKFDAAQTVRQVKQASLADVQAADQRLQRAEDNIRSTEAKAARELRSAKQAASAELSSLKDRDYSEARLLATREAAAQDRLLREQDRAVSEMKDLKAHSSRRLKSAESAVQRAEWRLHTAEAESAHKRHLSAATIAAEASEDKHNLRLADELANKERDRYAELESGRKQKLERIAAVADTKTQAVKHKGELEIKRLAIEAKSLNRKAHEVAGRIAAVHDTQHVDVKTVEDATAEDLHRAQEEMGMKVQHEEAKVKGEEARLVAETKKKAQDEVDEAKAHAKQSDIRSEEEVRHAEKLLHLQQHAADTFVHEAELLEKEKLKNRHELDRKVVAETKRSLEEAEQRGREHVQMSIEHAEMRAAAQEHKLKQTIDMDLTREEKRLRDKLESDDREQETRRQKQVQHIHSDADEQIERLTRSTEKKVADASHAKDDEKKAQSDAKITIAAATKRGLQLENSAKRQTAEARRHLETVQTKLAQDLEKFKMKEAEAVKDAKDKANNFMYEAESMRKRRIDEKIRAQHEFSDIRGKRLEDVEKARRARELARINEVETSAFQRQAKMFASNGEREVGNIEQEAKGLEQHERRLREEESFHQVQANKKLHSVDVQGRESARRTEDQARRLVLDAEMQTRQVRERTVAEVANLERVGEEDIEESHRQGAERTSRQVSQARLNANREIRASHQLAMKKLSTLASELRLTEKAARMDKKESQTVPDEADMLNNRIRDASADRMRQLKNARALADNNDATLSAEKKELQSWYTKDVGDSRIKDVKERGHHDLEAMKTGMALSNENARQVTEGYTSGTARTRQATIDNAQTIRRGGEAAVNKIKAKTEEAGGDTKRFKAEAQEAARTGADEREHAADAIHAETQQKLDTEHSRQLKLAQKYANDLGEFKTQAKLAREEMQKGWVLEDEIHEDMKRKAAKAAGGDSSQQ
eukprot:TRINITY_DN36472_c0_g1_i1.p1 TRINITY_DN36472_c0_g1~~TRINITY_DN36472_c0_g1_i1.p1  ORF type:complete len:1483 (+),score=576.97 TRINITY_DN36472_c0_g1_i1:128-4576(+)